MMIKRAVLLVALMLIVLPSQAFAEISGSGGWYHLTNDEYSAYAPEGSASTVQLKTPDGLTKYIVPSNLSGYLSQAYIHVGRTLNANNYLTVTFGDGVTKIYGTGSEVSGNVTIFEADFAAHPSRGLTIKYTNDGTYDETVYLYGFLLDDTVTGTATPTAITSPTPNGSPSTASATPTPTPSPSSGSSASSGPTPTPSSGTGGTGGTGDGSTSGCMCQQLCDLMPVLMAGIGDDLNDIYTVMAPVHGDLVTIHNDLFGVRDDLSGVQQTLNRIDNNTAPLHQDFAELLRQLTPTQNYSVPSNVPVPPYYSPPDVAAQPYQDNGTYFTDQGDAAAPDAMPAAPDPVNWSYNGVTINQEPGVVQDTKQNKDHAMSAAPIMTAAPGMTSAPAMSAAPDMTSAPAMLAAPDMTSAPAMSVNPVMTSGPGMVRDPVMQMQNDDYSVRWDYSDR